MREKFNNVNLFRLKGHLRHYHWGDPHFIPHLLGEPNPEGRPHAELWFGSHPQGMATVLPEGVPLAGWLAERGLRLPLLLKVVAARKPLSIQVHPDGEQARRGYRQGRFPDPYPKPELFYALKDSWFLSGFLPPQEIGDRLERLATLTPRWRRWLSLCDDPKRLYAELIALPQREIDALLDPVLERLRTSPPPPGSMEHWLLVADTLYSGPSGHDLGLFSFFLLHFVHLRPGEVLFTPPRRPHALLQGFGVELMVCSDNVVRGGLTVKPVDPEAFLEIVSSQCSPPPRLGAVSQRGVERWAVREAPPLLRLSLPSGVASPLHGEGPKLGFLLQGEILFGEERVRQGEGFLATGGPIELLAPGGAELFYSLFEDGSFWGLPEEG